MIRNACLIRPKKIDGGGRYFFIDKDMSSSVSESDVPSKKSSYNEADRKYYLLHKEQCLERSRPHKMAYWLAHKEELKAKRREHYEKVEKPRRLAKKEASTQ